MALIPVPVDTGEALSTALDVAKDFLLKIAGPAVEELGFLLQDQVKFYRLKNQLRILGKSQKMLEEAHIEPRAIPFRTLLPILECSALEDDEALGTKWAALLANAATPQTLASHPSFPKLLSELVPLEAEFLDFLVKSGEASWSQFATETEGKLEVSATQVEIFYINLVRLGLIRHTRRSLSSPGIFNNYVAITPFGLSFLEACTPPVTA